MITTTSMPLKDGYHKTIAKIIYNNRLIQIILISNKDGQLSSYKKLSAITVLHYGTRYVYQLNLPNGFLSHPDLPLLKIYKNGKKDTEQFFETQSSKTYPLTDFLDKIQELLMKWTNQIIDLRKELATFFSYPSRDNDLPAVLCYHKDHISTKIWYLDGCKGRNGDKPSCIRYIHVFPGKWVLSEEVYYHKNMMHRDEDKPSFIAYDTDGSINHKLWRQHDKVHRNDNPASIYYYSSGKIKEEVYFKNGNIHRDDGPAIVYYLEDGTKSDNEWWLEGKEMKS